MQKKFLLFLLVIISIGTISAEQPDLYDWNIFLYVESSGNLQKEAIKNIFDIAHAGVSDNVHIGLVLHTHGPYAWLISIEDRRVTIEDYFPLTNSHITNLTQAAGYFFSRYPAEHYGVVLWNHGFGILQPEYDVFTDSWFVRPDGDDVGACELTTTAHETVQPRSHRHHQLSRQYCQKCRGMLIDDYHKICMDNWEMVETFKAISEEILQGQKVDFVAMDLCLGAMIEHGYQLRNYVDYLTGTQDCELADGIDYFALMHHLNHRHLSAREVVTHIVQDYDNYYAPIAPIGRYTHAAFDLNYMEVIKNNLDEIVDQLLIIYDHDARALKELMRQTRQETLVFCIGPYYKDLHQMYELLHKKLTDFHLPAHLEHLRLELQELLIIGQNLIKNAVVANATGPATAAAHGISIYWPAYDLDPSYQPTPFAQESRWLEFLMKLLH